MKPILLVITSYSIHYTKLYDSFIGYKTHTADIILQKGQNVKNVMLQLDNIHLEPILVNAQKREQQILDVPTAISSVSAQTMEQSNITSYNFV